MATEGKVEKGTMTIRVFYPNQLGSHTGGNRLDLISKQYVVTYLEVCDPIYHELCFYDDHNTRHRIIGLPYHIEERIEDSGGVDAQA